MTTVSDVVDWLERFAPARLAEPWDNVGLLWGDPSAVVQAAMTCLTVTPVTAAEAIEEGAALIVSHHPILFREVKRIRADFPDTAPLWKLARAGVAIASPHTAFDNTRDGINDILCHRLGLNDVTHLRPAPLCATGAVMHRINSKLSSSRPSPTTRPSLRQPSRPGPAGLASTKSVRSRSPEKAHFSEPRRRTPS